MIEMFLKLPAPYKLMKKWMILFLCMLSFPLVFAMDNTFSISFHGIGGNQSISINLADYMAGGGPYKYAPVENLNIVIENGIATISPKDPEWRGIEDVIFAPIGVEIKAPTGKPGAFLNATGTRVRRNLTVSKWQLDTAMGDAVSKSFFIITGNLTNEPLNISGFLSKNSVRLDINDELSLNISVNKNSRSYNPGFSIDVHNKETNLSLAQYEEPSNWLFYGLAGLILAALVIIVAYFYTGYAQDVLSAAVSKEEKPAENKSVTAEAKRRAQIRLATIRKKIDLSPEGALKEAMGVVNGFFSSYLHMTFVSKDKIVDKLAKKGKGGALQESVASLYDDYAGLAYGKKGISKSGVSAFISKASNVMRQC